MENNEDLNPNESKVIKGFGLVMLLVVIKLVSLYMIFVGGFGLTIVSWPIMIIGLLLLGSINVGMFKAGQMMQTGAKAELAKRKTATPPAE